MKSKEKTFWEVLSVITVIVVLLSALQEIQSHRKVEALLRPGPIPKPRFIPPQEKAEIDQSARALDQLWQARNERDVTAEVAPFLQNKYGSVQNMTVHVLAHLNTPAAETAISDYIETKQKEFPYSYYTPLDLRMALGRAQARDLTGQAKFNAVGRSADLNFYEVTLLFAKINEGKRPDLAFSDGYFIMQEMVDLLMDMDKQEENIKPIVSQLTLNLAQQVQLKAPQSREAMEGQYWHPPLPKLGNLRNTTTR